MYKKGDIVVVLFNIIMFFFMIWSLLYFLRYEGKCIDLKIYVENFLYVVWFYFIVKLKYLRYILFFVGIYKGYLIVLIILKYCC